ncbi:MAG: hypothetical protein SOY53_05110, partial [Prevotella sp.]|nr:hypothetical protein [Prevotella sp.]
RLFSHGCHRSAQMLGRVVIPRNSQNSQKLVAYVQISTSQHLNISTSQHLTISTPHHFNISPPHHFTISPPQLLNTDTCN